MLFRRIKWTGILAFLIIPVILHAQKDDTVYMLNGDRITGELKKYESGILTLKTEGMSTLGIEYDKINTLHSAKYFEIVSKTGFSYYGSIRKSTVPASIVIVISNDTVVKAMNEIVEITPIKNRFWKKFYGSIDLGVSYIKSTQVLQYYLNTDINYRAKKDLVMFDMSLMFNDQKINDSVIRTRKNDIGLGLNHFFQGRWWLGVGAMWQQNTELELDYRIQLESGAGYDIVHTNPIRLYGMAGLLVNREKPTDSVSASTNFEGLLSMKFTWLRYRYPEMNISSNIDAYPSFTVSGRWRLEFNLTSKIEIFRDFYLSLSFYDDFDSKPSGGGSSLNDWSIIFSVGYSF